MKNFYYFPFVTVLSRIKILPMRNALRITGFWMLPVLMACSSTNTGKNAESMNEEKKNPVYSHVDTSRISLPENEWQRILPHDVYKVAREKGTERPFSGKYNQHDETGTYFCTACGNKLFSSNGKFQSSCGWPSFFEPASKGSLIYAPDNSYGMERTEVMCGRCKAHLGHVFEDGPPPTGLRYCINSVSLDFEAAEKADREFKKQHPDSSQ